MTNYHILQITVLGIPSAVVLAVFIWYWFKGHKANV